MRSESSRSIACKRDKEKQTLMLYTRESRALRAERERESETDLSDVESSCARVRVCRERARARARERERVCALVSTSDDVSYTRLCV